MCIYLKRQVRFKLILFGGRLESPQHGGMVHLYYSCDCLD